MTTILIGADVCPIGRNRLFFQRGDATSLINDLQLEFKRADVSIVNLECPLIEKESLIKKCGPNLGAPVGCVNGLKALGVGIAGLANNHVMDHGPQGLRTTIQALCEQGIAYVGAGETLEEARRILVREVNGMRVGILAVAEHEFGIATRNTAGVNPLDVIDIARNINAHRSECDYLIVLVHGGNELYPYPRPGLMDTCRFLVEQGVNAVICQHSHCAGCMERHHGMPIVYGQGNLLFDEPSAHGPWHEGALISLEIAEDGRCETKLIPFTQSDGCPGARKMTAADEQRFLGAFHERSCAIAQEAFVEEQWLAFCRERKRDYLRALHGKRGVVRRLLDKLDLLPCTDSCEVQRMRLNLIHCESHREALVTLLSLESSQNRGS